MNTQLVAMQSQPEVQQTQHTAMRLDFAEKNDFETSAYSITLNNDNAGDLRTVLAAMTVFLRAAGFVYVVALGAETDVGSMIFSDEV